jgi:hypothetical protein
MTKSTNSQHYKYNIQLSTTVLYQPTRMGCCCPTFSGQAAKLQTVSDIKPLPCLWPNNYLSVLQQGLGFPWGGKKDNSGCGTTRQASAE